MAEPRTIDVEPEHLRIVLDILRRLAPQDPVWAFGSRAVGKAKRYSDLDLAIMTDTPLSLARRSALAEAFSDSDLRRSLFARSSRETRWSCNRPANRDDAGWRQNRTPALIVKLRPACGRH
jgi:predicted nucleotidyltransferase